MTRYAPLWGLLAGIIAAVALGWFWLGPQWGAGLIEDLEGGGKSLKETSDAIDRALSEREQKDEAIRGLSAEIARQAEIAREARARAARAAQDALRWQQEATALRSHVQRLEAERAALRPIEDEADALRFLRERGY